MTSNDINVNIDTRRFWLYHAIWTVMVFAVAWLTGGRQLTPAIVTLGAILVAGQATIGIPILLNRALPWTVLFTIVFDSVILLGQLWQVPPTVAPIYIGLALLPASLVGRWRQNELPALTFWVIFAIVDLVVRFQIALETLSLTNPALLMWIGMLPIVPMIVPSGEQPVPAENQQPTDDSISSPQLFTTINRLAVATTPEQSLEVALETIGEMLMTTETGRILGLGLTFSKVDLEEFVVSAIFNTDKSWKGRHMPIQGIAHEAMMGGDPALAQTDQVLIDAFPALRDRWILLLPLYTRLEVYGVLLFAHRSEPELRSSQLELFDIIAHLTSQRLRIHHLRTELERSRHEILLDEEDTRHQLARDLHDGPVQKVSALSMQLDFMRHLLEKEPEKVPAEIADAQQMVQEATHELRTFMFGLRPVVLETEGLVPALEQFTKRLRTQDSLNVTLEAEPVPRLDSTIEQNTFAIVREAVGNAKKHANGAPITISIELAPTGLRTVVSDEGPGFELEKVERGYGRRVSLGLLNMKERAEMIDGFLEIRTAPGEGTDVELFVPTRNRDV